MIKLIASDLDGTLLQNGAQALTPRAIDLISRLCDAGIHFVSASGRQYDNQKRVFAPLKDRISFIAENGSICMHQGKVISRATINDDLAARILKEIKKQDHFEIVVSEKIPVSSRTMYRSLSTISSMSCTILRKSLMISQK